MYKNKNSLPIVSLVSDVLNMVSKVDSAASKPDFIA